MSTKTNSAKTKQLPVVLQTGEDLKNALLVVSMVINLFIFTAWLVIQVDPSVSLVLVETR